MSIRDVFSSFALILNTDWFQNDGGPYPDSTGGSYRVANGSTLSIVNMINTFDKDDIAQTWGMVPNKLQFSNTIDFSGVVVDDPFIGDTGVTALGNSITDLDGQPITSAGISGGQNDVGYAVVQVANPQNLGPDGFTELLYVRYNFDITGNGDVISA